MLPVSRLAPGTTLLLALALGAPAPSARAAPAPQETEPPATGEGAGPEAGKAKTPTERLTFDQTLGGRGGISFGASLPPFSWAHDGRHIQTGRGPRRVWIDPATGKRTEPQPDPARRPAPADLQESFSKVSGLKDRALARALSPRSIQRSVDGAVRLVTAGKRLFVHRGDPKDEAGWTLIDLSKHDVDLPRLAPSGEAISVRIDRQLTLVDTKDGSRRALSGDGSDDVLYGRLDWVYQEEVYGRGRWNASWWSPTGSHLAYLRVDQTAVPTYPLTDLTAQHPETRTMRYPKAGDANPTARLFVAPRTGTPVEVDLSSYPDEHLIVRVGWTPTGDRLLLQVTDRIQTRLDLLTADPKTGAVARLLREESSTWVNILGEPRWLADGTFLWESERTGFNHLYHYTADGRLLHTVTNGPWGVRRVLDVRGDTVFFTGSRDGAVDRRAYKVQLDGTGLTALTKEPGSHTVRVNHDGSFLIDQFSSAKNPGEVRLLNGDGEVVEVLAKARVKALTTHVYSPVEMLTIESRDGFVLDASLVRPPDFDPLKVYPVWVPTYSGPNAPSVTHRWGADTWTQFLAQQGVLVLRVNVRSASGKGQAHTGTCYKQLGVQELRDIEDAVAWLTAHPWADAERVGISGWSYGGFMAAYALTHSKRFALGVAGAGVYDWRNYDTIYTERYMRTPQENAAGYDATSCVKAAKDLHGHLLIAHGTQDDNVHVQNALQLAYELQQAGKSFDLMLYPKSGHGLRSRQQRRHHRENTWRAIQRYLLRR